MFHQTYKKKQKAQESFPLVVHYYHRGHIFCAIVCIIPGNYSHQQVITAMGPHFAVGIGIKHGPWGLVVCDWGKYAKNRCVWKRQKLCLYFLLHLCGDLAVPVQVELVEGAPVLVQVVRVQPLVRLRPLPRPRPRPRQRAGQRQQAAQAAGGRGGHAPPARVRLLCVNILLQLSSFIVNSELECRI